ncbi:30S ribosomal protein S20 [Botrimarina colliarenosi]|uniref:Small ribosomal subunit protein bS20 n=1 Tax=Botrimarina colliarenosi TaxID=2528001 RepID=A0A5C6AJU6_9BACT|nr:30S ribosomal protein S20 [Botrimarina colliarenosi]TWT99686.1 30S ribosomal protein S20 [Botrimarina colliarenosi]
MPNSPNAKKRLRQNKERRLVNRSARTSLRTQVKKVRAAIAEGDVEKSEAAYLRVQKTLDKAASSNLIHANAAARTKARLTKAIKAVKASAAS